MICYNEQLMSTKYQFNTLPDSAIVYRALLRRQWIDEANLVVSSAYLLRANEPGLSVTIASVSPNNVQQSSTIVTELLVCK
jgi:hypothetical protein